MSIQLRNTKEGPQQEAQIQVDHLLMRLRKRYWLKSKGHLRTTLMQKYWLVANQIVTFSSAKVVQALLRDGYQCLVTGFYAVQVSSDPDIDLDEEAIGHQVYTVCAHIVPDSSYFKVSANTSIKV